jgi:hypothetical protein
MALIRHQKRRERRQVLLEGSHTQPLERRQTYRLERRHTETTR